MKSVTKKSAQITTSTKHTTLNLQTRPFSSQTDVTPTNEAIENSPIEKQSSSSQNVNVLERLIATPKPDTSNVTIRKKHFASFRSQTMPIQAKLNIGEPNDKYEQEADKTATKVVQQINAAPQSQSVQRQDSIEEEEIQMKPISSLQRDVMEEEDELQAKPLVQRRENLNGGEASIDLESSIQSARGSGQSLDASLQAKMGQVMGADFSGVKVHTDAQSDQLNKSIQAKAFTTGQDVFFRQGAYDPSSRGGQELIAHELTHVVQQNPIASANRKMDLASDSNPLQLSTDLNFQTKLLVSSAQFKNATIKGSSKKKRSKQLKQIDICLKKIEQTGEDIILLSELLEAIVQWQNKAKISNPRYDAIEALRKHVANEIYNLQKTLDSDDSANPVSGDTEKISDDFSDFDSKQFRVSGRAPTRRIEEVKRKKSKDGKVTYYATGLVTGFDGKVPLIAPYARPISLGDWYPSVTHINGMAVAPKGGILSAAALQESINKALDGKDDVAFGQDAVDVLYTYSALRGGTIGDLWDCIKGKAQVEDSATIKQEEIMLDAVRAQRRVTVSAHSRGTIKTDNAVRIVHKILAKEFIPFVKADRYDEVMDYCENIENEYGIEKNFMAEHCFKYLAAEKAQVDMNKFIQLIYAGNAVQHPSKFIDINMYVGGVDFVSMFVGTYSNVGRKVDASIGTGGSKKSKLHSVGKGKGHGFVGNYIPEVSQAIASDIRKR